MPDDGPTQQDVVTPFTTEGRLGGIAREALVADTGTAKLAGLVREALIAGVGLAGRIGARSYAQAALTTVTAGLVLGGSITARTKARIATPTLLMPIAGRITARSAATAWLPVSVSIAGRIKTTSAGRLLQRNAILIAAQTTAQSKARGLMYVQTGAYRAQWGVTVNTG